MSINRLKAFYYIVFSKIKVEKIKTSNKETPIFLEIELRQYAEKVGSLIKRRKIGAAGCEQTESVIRRTYVRTKKCIFNTLYTILQIASTVFSATNMFR